MTSEETIQALETMLAEAQQVAADLQSEIDKDDND